MLWISACGLIIILQVFAKNPEIPSERDEMEEDSKFWAMLFLVLAFAMLLGNVLQVSKHSRHVTGSSIFNSPKVCMGGQSD